MSKDQTSSLESEIEEIRERLASTIDELIYRGSPKTIAQRQVAAVKAVYVDQTTGEPRMGNIAKTVGGVVGVGLVMATLRMITRTH